ncbi:membrane protein [Gammaproteobacteria bacterium]|nr:membrane protein [Gammaproteobacteria bacterium]
MSKKNVNIDFTREKVSAFEPLLLLSCFGLSIIGAIIGMQLIVRLGISANTSILGALIAICFSRIQIASFLRFKNLDRQNLIQTSVSSATFGAANSLMIAIGVPWAMGLPDLIWPMLIGATLAMMVDGSMLYGLFGTRTFPEKGTWPAGVATAEALWAGDKGGKKAWLLGAGILTGIGGAFVGIPMSAAGVALIGNLFALFMFAIGLLVRGYSNTHQFTDYIPHFDIYTMYLPHGFMIGAGLVALIQVIIQIVKSRQTANSTATDKENDRRFMRTLKRGFLSYLVIALLLAFLAQLTSQMSLPMLLGFIVFAAVAAIVQEMIVGIAAMYSGWFPAFAAALISLIVGMLLGFPPTALGILVGYCVATGPAFADMGFDLRTGYLIRGEGADPELEKYGRRQQYFAAMLGFLTAALVVALTHQIYFDQGLVVPASKIYAATIIAGTSAEVARNLMMWAIPGALLQLLGGPSRQLGILFATGLIINYPIAGWTVLVALACRVVLERVFKKTTADTSSFAGGLIAGDALFTAGKMLIPALKAKLAIFFIK